MMRFEMHQDGAILYKESLARSAFRSLNYQILYLDTNENCLSTHFCFCRVFYVLSVYGYSKYCLLKYCLFVSGLLRLLVILLCKSCSPAPSKTKRNHRSEKNSPCPDVVFDYEIFVCILQYVLICHYLPAYNLNETVFFICCLQLNQFHPVGNFAYTFVKTHHVLQYLIMKTFSGLIIVQ